MFALGTVPDWPADNFRVKLEKNDDPLGVDGTYGSASSCAPSSLVVPLALAAGDGTFGELANSEVEENLLLRLLIHEPLRDRLLPSPFSFSELARLSKLGRRDCGLDGVVEEGVEGVGTAVVGSLAGFDIDAGVTGPGKYEDLLVVFPTDCGCGLGKREAPFVLALMSRGWLGG